MLILSIYDRDGLKEIVMSYPGVELLEVSELSLVAMYDTGRLLRWRERGVNARLMRAELI